MCMSDEELRECEGPCVGPCRVTASFHLLFAKLPMGSVQKKQNLLQNLLPLFCLPTTTQKDIVHPFLWVL